jgi:hypothetical protein
MISETTKKYSHSFGAAGPHGSLQHPELPANTKTGMK